MIPLLGFSPDVEPTTEGAILDADGIVPYESGMRAAPAAVSAGLSALASEVRGSAVIRQLSGGARMFAGTSTGMFEATGTTWNNVGGSYSLGSDDRWSFVGFGDSVLATCPSVGIIRSTGAAFSAVAGAPKAKIIVAAKGFIVAFSTEDATYGNNPDRWWCSALFNETDWTPNISTQATTGRLTEGSGGFTAAVRFGDEIIAYKNRAMFRGYYAGTPTVWDWRSVSTDVGCVGPEAAADTSAGHVFVGSDNIYLYDGTAPVPIATGVVRKWWLDNSSAEFRYRTKLLWDRDNGLVWIFFPSSSSSGACDDCIVYHVQAKKWGRVKRTVEAAVNYVSPGITYDTGSPLITSYDSGPAIAYDSPFWLASKSNPAIFGSSHQLLTLTGVPGDWWFETGDYGDEFASSFCGELRVRWALKPGTVTCTSKTKPTSGDTLTSRGTVGFDGSKFPLRQTDRFHRFRVDGAGPGQFTAIQPKLIPAGVR